MRRVLGANHKKPKPESAAVATGCNETAQQDSAPVDVDDAPSPDTNAPEEKASFETSRTADSNAVEIEDDFFGEAVCAECESGGLLDCCDGCARSWHAECLYHAALPGGEFIPPGSSKPPVDPDLPWLCDDCELRVHRCFLCKHYARDEALWRCGAQAEGCCKYYHRSCLRKWHSSLGLPLSSTAENACPRHRFCGRGDQCPVKNATSPRKSSDGSDDGCVLDEGNVAQEALSWRCLRCPVAYHSSCRPLDVHVVDYNGRVFSCMRHVLDGSGRKPSFDAISLLTGRRRLKLAGFPTLDEFQNDRRGKELRKAAASGAVPAVKGGSRLMKKSHVTALNSSEASSPRITPMAALTIPKKIPVKASTNGTPESPNLGSNSGGSSTVLRGTRMKIRGFDPKKEVKKVDLLTTETAAEKARRLGRTGLAVGGGIAKRGSKARASLMAWAAAQMANFDSRDSSNGDSNGGSGNCSSSKGSSDGNGSCSPNGTTRSINNGGVGCDNDEASHADPSLFPTSIYTAAVSSSIETSIDSAAAVMPSEVSNVVLGDAKTSKQMTKRSLVASKTDEITSQGVSGGSAPAAAEFPKPYNGSLQRKRAATGTKSDSLNTLPMPSRKSSSLDNSRSAAEASAVPVDKADEDDEEEEDEPLDDNICLVERNAEASIANSNPRKDTSNSESAVGGNGKDDDEDDEDEPLDEVLAGVAAAEAEAAAAESARRPQQPIPLFVDQGAVVYYGNTMPNQQMVYNDEYGSYGGVTPQESTKWAHEDYQTYSQCPQSQQQLIYQQQSQLAQYYSQHAHQQYNQVDDWHHSQFGWKGGETSGSSVRNPNNSAGYSRRFNME